MTHFSDNLIPQKVGETTYVPAFFDLDIMSWYFVVIRTLENRIVEMEEITKHCYIRIFTNSSVEWE